MSDAGHKLADSRELLALHQLSLGGLETFDRFLELLARAPEIIDHLVKDLGEFAALIPGDKFDVFRKISLADRFGAIPQFAKRLRGLVDDEHDHAHAYQDPAETHDQDHAAH